MAYTPKTWVCGETITAEGLNNIEEGIQDALECCEDKGYECTESQATVFEGSLTTVSEWGMCRVEFTPSQPIEGDSIAVTLNGTEYELPKATVSFGDGYGEFDAYSNPVFTNYPCAVGIINGQYYFYTPSDGTYQVVINTTVSTVETSECFEKAVKKFGLKYVKDYSSDNGGVVENSVSENVASGDYSHAEGNYTTASGNYSHAEGNYTTASSPYSHAEGNGSTASGEDSHAEGGATIASGIGSHAEGGWTTASGADSHAEGNYTTASGDSSHAEGDHTTASGNYSHAEGNRTIANHFSQHVFGSYNIADPSTASSTQRGNYVEIVGNGANNNNRSNARTLDWNGNEVLKGSLTLGQGTADETTITATQLKALLALLQ